jgi:nucleoid DNA-binding protein
MAARKKTAKKAPTKAKSTAKAKAKAPAKKATKKAITEPLTKSQLLTELADSTELSKKQVQAVLDELADIIERHVKKRAAGQFTLPGLMKITVARKPATRARKGINPFTGEETTFKAKPARNVVKVRPLKKLKDMVA